MMKRKQYVSVNRYCIRICNNNVEIYHNSILLSIGKLLGCRIYSVHTCKKPNPGGEASRSYSVLFAIFPRMKCYFCFSSSSRSSQSSCDHSSQLSSASMQAVSHSTAKSSHSSSHCSSPSHASKHASKRSSHAMEQVS